MVQKKEGSFSEHETSNRYAPKLFNPIKLLILSISHNFDVRGVSGKILQVRFSQKSSVHRECHVTSCIRRACFCRPISSETRLPLYTFCVYTNTCTQHGPRYERNIRASSVRIRRSLFPRQIYLACLEFEDAPPIPRLPERLQVYDTYVWFAVSPCTLDISSVRNAARARPSLLGEILSSDKRKAGARRISVCVHAALSRRLDGSCRFTALS